MPMQASVKYFRGVDDISINIAGVTLIAGHNGVGKSSLLQAIQAAATGAAVPFFKSEKPDSPLITKKDAKELVHDGQEIGGIRLKTDDGAMQIGWPSLDVESKGAPVQISRVAAGIITPLDMEPKDRAAFFARLLETEPTKDELVEALTAKEVGLVPASGPGDDERNDQDGIDELVEKVEIGGYDGAHDYVKTNGAKLKGRWEEVTRKRYGVSKSDWLPEGWTEEFAAADPAALEEQLAEARHARDNIAVQTAVDAAALQQLQENAQKEQTAKALYDDATHKAIAASKNKQDAAELLAKAKKFPRLIACKHCGGMLQVVAGDDGSISAEESALTQADVDKALAALTEAQSDFDVASAAYQAASKTESDALAQWNQLKGSKQKYADAARVEGGDGGDADARAEAEGAVQAIEAKLEMVKTKARADRLHASIVLHVKIIDVLAPTGLRQKKLKAALDDFNTLLGGTCAGAGFDPVQLRDDLSVTYGARPYLLASKSQQWRCRVAVQLATAVREHAPLAIIDDADILDSAAREGFLQSLITLSKPEEEDGADMKVLVGMTLPKPESAPPLGKLKLGATYWLEQGKVANSM